MLRAKFRDSVNHEDVSLTAHELDMIRKIQQGMYPDADVNPYEPWVDHFTQDVEVQPIHSAPEPKRRFIPSKWEHKRIMKLVRAIRAGHILPSKPKEKEAPQFYAIWDDTNDQENKHPMHIPAPKLQLPDTSESYNPPEEYIPTPEEIAEWESMDPEDRPRHYLPHKYDQLRTVPGYQNFIQERFSRCLDLYLCPRAMRKRVLDPESLLPSLPDPKDLEPFPKNLAVVYKGHVGRVRCCVAGPSGEWLLSGAEDKQVRLWEVETGRVIRVWQMEEEITSISWNPNKDVSLFAVAA
jgi:ribosome biogenesis protein ERB1